MWEVLVISSGCGNEKSQPYVLGAITWDTKDEKKEAQPIRKQ